MPAHDVLFGASLGQWNGADAADATGRIRLGTQADRDGLDLFTVADHPYFGDKLDAYALTAFLLGRTERITGMVTVTNLPSRPAPVLARTLTSLSALSGGRVILGIGAGAIWDMITKLGVPRLNGGAAVRAMAEAITLVRALSGGGEAVTFDGEFYHVDGLDPAAAPAPRVFTGSVGPKSLAVTGQLADGWIPPGGSDWLSQLYASRAPASTPPRSQPDGTRRTSPTCTTSAAASPPTRSPPPGATTAAGSAAPSGSGSTSSPPPSWTTTRSASSTATRTTPPPTRPWPAGPPRSSPPSAPSSPDSPRPVCAQSPLHLLRRNMAAAETRDKALCVDFGPILRAFAPVLNLAGLVDEYQLFLVPAVVGGGARALPDQVRLNLALAEERTFGRGTVYLCYRPA